MPDGRMRRNEQYVEARTSERALRTPAGAGATSRQSPGSRLVAVKPKLAAEELFLPATFQPLKLVGAYGGSTDFKDAHLVV